MDSIKKKMTSLATETGNAQARAERWQRQLDASNATADAFEEQVGRHNNKYKFDLSLLAGSSATEEDPGDRVSVRCLH